MSLSIARGRSLAVGTSFGALAAALIATTSPLHAQSFQGTPNVQSGSASITTGPGVTNIVVDTPRAVINWDAGNPAGAGQFNFQPAGTTANFLSSPSVSYMVLNRILPTDPTRVPQFNGTVNADGTNGVFFYSPGGIVIGNTARFNVGRLLLTTNDPVVDANGDFFVANRLSLAGPVDSTSNIIIAQGAQFNAPAEGSFILAVAPRVSDAGTTMVNGTKALVAAEAVDMTYNAGLFDITVTRGTSLGGDVLRHDGGSTTGPASGGAGDFHRVYMVAVPKNNAISMFVSGANGLGFDVAGAANVSGNAIVLSAGHNVSAQPAAGTIDADDAFVPTAVSTTAADIFVTRGNYTSFLNARASQDANVSDPFVGGARDINFRGSVAVRATRNAFLTSVGASAPVNIAEDLVLSADARSSINDGSNQQAGTAILLSNAPGSAISVGGSATVTAVGRGASVLMVGDGGNGQGGRAAVQLNGGTISVNGDLTTNADGFGGNGGNGGLGRGGVTDVQVTNGTLTVNGSLTSQAGGLGGTGTIGGNGTGGQGQYAITNGSLIAQGGALATNADAVGGNGTVRGGNATAGSNTVNVTGATASLVASAATLVDISAQARGGQGLDPAAGIGGNATGGTVSLLATNGGQIGAGNRFDVNAFAQGGNGGAGSAAAGGNAQGGTAQIEATTSGAIRLTRTTGIAIINSFATGGSGGTGGAGIGGTARITTSAPSTFAVASGLRLDSIAGGGAGSAGAGGAATAGRSELLSGGTTDITGALGLRSNATGGAGTVGGTATGGTSTVNVTAGTLRALNTFALESRALGGAGSSGNGGVATGGTATLFNSSTTNVTGAVTADANATGGANTGSGAGGNTGGSATGGRAFIDSVGATTLSSTFTATSNGIGGAGLNGGAGTGGNAGAVIRSGNLNVTGASVVSANGTGAGAVPQFAGTGGAARGGTVSVQVDSIGVTNPVVGLAAVTASANATGGAGGSVTATTLALGIPVTAGGRGGDATAGSVGVGSLSNSGTVVLGALTAQANAVGGVGGSAGTLRPGGAGANGTGGTVLIGLGDRAGTGTGTMRIASVTASTFGAGNLGNFGTTLGLGGNGRGGTAIIGNGAGGAVSVSGSTSLTANGFAAGAGTVANAGTANAGNAVLATAPNPTGGVSSLTMGNVNLEASGFRGEVVAPGAPRVDQPIGNHGRAVIYANRGQIQTGAATIRATGSAGLTSVASTGGLLNSGLATNGARIIVVNSFDGTFDGDVALSPDGADINQVSTGFGGFTLNTNGTIVDSLLGTAPVAPARVTSTNFLDINARGNIETPGNVYLSQFTIDMTAGGNLNASGLGAGGYIYAESGGDMTIGGVLSQDIFEAVSGGNMTLGNIRSDSDTDLLATGDVITGTISSGDSVTIGSQGSIVTGNIDAGINTPSTDPDVAYAVGLRGAGDVATGTITAVNRIGVGSENGAVSTGAISAGEFFLTLAKTGVSVNGGITTGTGPNGITYIADSSMLALIDPVTLDPTPVFNAAPVRLGGPVQIDGDVQTGRFASASTGNFTTQGAINALDAAGLNIDSGGTVSTVALTANLGDVLVRSDGALATGAISSGRDVSLDSSGADPTDSITTEAITAAGNLTLYADGNVSTLNLTAGNTIEVDPNGGNATLGNIRAEQLVRIESEGVVTTGSISAGDYIEISGETGAPASVSTGALDAGILRPSSNSTAIYNVGVRAIGNVSVGAIDARRSVAVLSDQGSVAAGNVNANGFLLALAQTGVSLGSISTGSDANSSTFIGDSLATRGPDFDPVNLDSDPTIAAVLAGQPARLNGPVSISGTVQTGRFALASTGNFTAQGAINASRSAAISSGGLATFNGIVSSPTIDLISAGLDIGASGGLGTSATNALTIDVEPNVASVRVGGDPGTGYVIDGAEMPRLRAQTIRIRANGSNAPTVSLGGFALQGAAGTSPNLVGANGALNIETTGSIRVNGNVAINGAADSNALSLSAARRIDVITDQGGSIRMSNAAGEPIGTLNLNAATVASATNSVIDQLTQNSNFAGRDTVLDATATTPVPEGYVGAGQINVRVTNGFFVQNSNTERLRGGFTVGAGGLTVAPRDGTTGPIEMVINGRAAQAGGLFLNNQRTKDAATFSPLSAFAPSAKLNGCPINGAFCSVFGGGPLELIGTRQADTIEDNDEERTPVAVDGFPEVVIRQLISNPAQGDQPQITEPVTGSGNSQLWSKESGEQP
jgi:filamentous hemagglutinin family protein